MSHLRRVVAPAYVVAGILILFTLLDVVQAVWPPRAGEVGWRVVTAGLVSRVLVAPLIALLLVYAAALIAEQRRVLRIAAVCEAALALLVLVGLAAFALDALQVRTQVGPDGRDAYDLGLLISFAKWSVTVAFLLYLAWSQWKAGARLTREAGRKGGARTPLVVKTLARHPPPPPVSAGE